MKRTLLIAAAAAALAAPARAEWKNFDGQKIESLIAKEWFNAGEEAPSLSALRGKVWILEFFATW